MALDFCDLLWKMRGRFFSKDRDITLMSSRVLVLGDGTEIPSSALVPVGGIILWSGSIGSIPTNWQICDGTNSTPDLRNRFVVGAGDTYAVNDTGGSATIDIQHNHGNGSLAAASDSHSHGNGSLAAASDSHSHGDGSLTAANDTHNHNRGTLTMGAPTSGQIVQSGTGVEVAHLAHVHVLSGSTANDTHNHTVSGSTASDSHSHNVTGSTASDSHTHDVTGSTADELSTTQSILPPYYALAYIQRLS